MYNLLLETVAVHDHPPALIVDIEGNAPPFGEPRRLDNGIWIISLDDKDDEYNQQIITLNDDRTHIEHVENIYLDTMNLTALLEDPDVALPASVRDDTYNKSIVELMISFSHIKWKFRCILFQTMSLW